MTIWVDADACPVVVKEIIFRAAIRTETQTTLIANSFIKVPSSKYITFLQVPQGFDVADNEIVRRADEGDLVITADIPLAAEVMEKGAIALNPRGERYSDDTIKQTLNLRDFMDTMRSSGEHTGGPPPLNQSNRQAFANELDKYLVQQKKVQQKKVQPKRREQ
ncbi:MAG: YaiI/YqxD family protein [Proteobacteria bacterium]|nr:YaiI/YqxD family protein [Pseudomonadota bacterium]